MSGADGTEFQVDFPTLWVLADWGERHCVVPDGFRKGEPFRDYDWQLWCTLNHYRVKPTAVIGQGATAFHYRRSQIVAPQKIGKGPWSAKVVAGEAVGPTVFNGWARGGEVYDCEEWGCGCGWTYVYRAGEPTAIPQPTPLIQLTAFSVDQTDNVYRPLQSMIRNGPLSHTMRVGEEFIRLPNDGRIDVVTSSAMSRLGNPITFALQDESGIWTATNGMTRVATTQRRGAAGMGGRTMETTNAWDPSEDSVAQKTAESTAADIFRFHRVPPAHWSYRNKQERRRIHRFVYAGSLKEDGGHIDLDAIEGEAAEILATDPAEAERFFGNRIVYGQGSWLSEGLWTSLAAPRPIKPRLSICIGMDGSINNDWTGIRAETLDGWSFTPTYGPDSRPTAWNPAEWGGEIPRGEVRAALDEIMTTYQVERAYFDPEDWESEIDAWALRYGEKRVLWWRTNRITAMYEAIRRTEADLRTGALTHDGCKITATHVANARKVAKPGQKYLLAKPNERQKIDMAMASILAHEAAADARTEGWGRQTTAYAYSA